jgi:hypothetical protein
MESEFLTGLTWETGTERSFVRESMKSETTFRVMPFPSPVFKENVIAHARRVGFPAEFVPNGG